MDVGILCILDIRGRYLSPVDVDIDIENLGGGGSWLQGRNH